MLTWWPVCLSDRPSWINFAFQQKLNISVVVSVAITSKFDRFFKIWTKFQIWQLFEIWSLFLNLMILTVILKLDLVFHISNLTEENVVSRMSPIGLLEYNIDDSVSPDFYHLKFFSKKPFLLVCLMLILSTFPIKF